MKDATAISTNTTKPGARFEVYREILPKVLRSPVTWALALIMLLSAGYLLWIGQGKLLISPLVIVTYSVIMMLATLPLTAGKPEAAWEVAPTCSRNRLWLQIGVILLLWLLLQFVVFEGNGVLNLSHFALPLLNAFYQNAIGTIVGIFIIQAVVAVGLMRLMGARWSELGFSKGYRSWSVVALWSTPWIVAALIALLLGHATVPLILGNLLISFFIAAIPEEFLFRGVLMTRIMQLTGSMQWSIGLSALLFGLSHLSINIHNQGGNVPAAIALTLLNFVFTGVVSAVIFQRTRSLLAGVLYHTVADGLGLLVLGLLLH